MQGSNLSEELERLMAGMSPLEKALRLAAAFGEVYGTRWKIEANADGGFSITEALPDNSQTL